MIDAHAARTWALLCTLGLVWGSSFMFTNIAVREVSPLTLVSARTLLSAAAIAPVALVWGRGLPSLATPDGRRLWVYAAGIAFVSTTGPFLLLSWAQTHISSALSGLYMAPMPLISLALSHVMVPGERMTPRRLAGFALGLSGVLILMGAEAFRQIGGDGLALMAQAASLLAGAGYAMGGVLQKLARPPEALGISAAIMLLAAAMVVPLTLTLEGVPSDLPSARAVGAVLFLGLAATALAQILIVLILREAGPPFLAQVNYQVPVWAVALGAIVLGEAVRPSFALSLALVLAGVFVAQTRPRRRPA